MSFDPVEIEINLKQNVENEGEKASRTIDNIASASDRSRKELEENIRIQKKVIGDLKTALADVSKEFSKFNIGTNDQKTLEQREKLSKVVRELKGELNGEEAALVELEKQTTSVSTKSKTLETRIRDIREAMATLKLEGKENTKEYAKLEEQLGILGTAYREVYNTQKELSSGGSQMEGVLSGLSALSGLLSAGAGAFGLFNSESENFEKIQTKVQSLMAITIGLQQISNTLHSTSAFRITTVTKAQQLWTASTTKLAVALGISNVAAKALMATLTLGLSVAITAAIALIDRYVSKQKKSAEEQKKMSDAVSQAAGDQINSFEKLKKSYEALGDDVKAQKKFLSDNKGEFEKLGIAVGDVNEAERAFSQEGTDAFRTAVIERAKSLAIMELAAERYKEIVAKQLKLDAMSDTKKWGGVADVENKSKTKLKNEIEADLAAWQKLIDEALAHETNANGALSGAGLKSPDKNAEKAEDKIKAAQEKLSKMNADIQGEIDAAIVAAMKEGSAKKEAELKAQYDKQKAIIEQKLKEVSQLEKITGKPATEQRSLLKSWADSEKAKYDALLQQLRDVTASEIGEIYGEIDDRLKNKLQKELSDINKYYDQRKADLKNLYTDENKIAEASANIETKRQNEISQVTKQNELEKLDFQTQIDLKRQQIKDRNVMLETQRQENLLKIEKAAAEKRLEKLREMQILGADVANEIDEITVALEEMNAELASIPEAKLQEALTNIQKISGSLSGLGGSIGDVFGAVGSSIGDIKSIISDKSAAAGGDKSANWNIISTGIANVVDMINMLTSAAANRKVTEKAFYQNQIALAHEYALSLNEQLRLQTELSGSGFVTNYAGQLEDGFSALTDATSGYQDALEKLSGGKAKLDLRNAVDWGNVGKGAAAGAGIGAAVGSVIPVIGTAIGAVVGTVVGGLVGLFGGKKKKEMFGGLLEVFPELIDASGNLNKELAQTLISTNQVDEATKQLLQNALDWADAVEAARAQIKDIVVDLAGDLGNSMKDAIVGAWEAGEDASKRMFDAASDSLEKFVEDLLYSTVFSDLFDQFADRLAASLDPENGDGDILDDYDWFMDEMTARDDQFLAALDLVKQRAKDRGFDMWSEKDTRQASSKALAAASQDSIDDLSGRITSVQGLVSDIRSYSAQSLDIERERTAMSLIIQSQLNTIADNTYYCRYLESMNRTLEDMNMKGVKLKS